MGHPADFRASHPMTRSIPGRTTRSVLTSGLAVLLLAAALRADDAVSPSHQLLSLVPADAALVLTVDDLRGHAGEFLNSPLAAELMKVPAVKAWFDSDKYRDFERSRDQIEGFFKVSLGEFRDQVLGDAVVLAVRVPQEGPLDPTQARGIVLLKARDPEMLRRLLTQLNDTQKENGEIASVEERKQGETTYHVRNHPAGAGRPADSYVILDEGTFAISNDEALVREVISRKALEVKGGRVEAVVKVEAESLAALPRFQALERRLPARALARIYLDPRLVARLLRTAPPPGTPGETRAVALLERWLEALDYAGFALVTRADRFVLEGVESFKRDKFESMLGRWAEAASHVDDRSLRVPAGTLAVATAGLDFPSLHQILVDLVPEADQPRLASLETIASGLALGHDFRTRIVPGLGPRVVATVDAPSAKDLARLDNQPPGGSWRFPMAAVLGLRNRQGSDHSTPGTIEDALENALRTALAFAAMDERNGHGRARIVSQSAAGAQVLTLEPAVPFAFAVDRAGHRLVLGTSASAVARTLECGGDANAGERVRKLRDTAFPDADAFVCIDLQAIQTLVEKNRERLTELLAKRDHRPGAVVSRDLDQVLAMSRLFDAAFMTSQIDATSATAHQVLGVKSRLSLAKAADGSRP